MNAAIRWGNRQRTILTCSIKNEWDWRQFREALEQSFRHMEKTSHKSHLVLDLQESRHAIRTPVMNNGHVMPDVPENCGLIIAISDDTRIHMALALLRRVNKPVGDRLLCTASEGEALDLLRQIAGTEPRQPTPATAPIPLPTR